VTPELEALLIASAPPTITAAGALLLGWMNSRKLSKVQTNVDGNLRRMEDKFDAATSALANYKAGVADVKAREP